MQKTSRKWDAVSVSENGIVSLYYAYIIGAEKHACEQFFLKDSRAVREQRLDPFQIIQSRPSSN